MAKLCPCAAADILAIAVEVAMFSPLMPPDTRWHHEQPEIISGVQKKGQFCLLEVQMKGVKVTGIQREGHTFRTFFIFSKVICCGSFERKNLVIIKRAKSHDNPNGFIVVSRGPSLFPNPQMSPGS